MKYILLCFSFGFLFACQKQTANNLTANLSDKTDLEQMKVVEDMVQNNTNVSTEVYSQLSLNVQKMVYAKLSLENKNELWKNKLLYALKSETDSKKIDYLNKLISFTEKVFANSISNDQILRNAKNFEQEGFSLFGKAQLIAIVATPAIPLLNAKDNSGQYSKPKSTGSCNCAVSSDYCSSRTSCIAPTQSCGSGSESFCGFLLLFGCDGICQGA